MDNKIKQSVSYLTDRINKKNFIKRYFLRKDRHMEDAPGFYFIPSVLCVSFFGFLTVFFQYQLSVITAFSSIVFMTYMGHLARQKISTKREKFMQPLYNFEAQMITDMKNMRIAQKIHAGARSAPLIAQLQSRLYSIARHKNYIAFEKLESAIHTELDFLHKINLGEKNRYQSGGIMMSEQDIESILTDETIDICWIVNNLQLHYAPIAERLYLIDKARLLTMANHPSLAEYLKTVEIEAHEFEQLDTDTQKSLTYMRSAA